MENYTKKPVIGILGGLHQPTTAHYAAQLTYANTAYCRAIAENGGIPFVIPLTNESEKDIIRYLSICDGLLAPGGEDVDPLFYHEAPLPQLSQLNRQMDSFWIRAVQNALERNMPILGICRGMQLVNVALGGSLYQDISLLNPEHNLHHQKQNRDYPMHKVVLEPDSKLAQITGKREMYTNTMHHQCVKELGRGLSLAARAEDGIPEALEGADGDILLLQWHPEELTRSTEETEHIFQYFIYRCDSRLSGGN